MTKLLFTDIDGTLIRGDGTLSPALIKGFQQAAANGHGLILASGRPLAGVLQVQRYLENDCNLHFQHSYILAFNGALIYDCNKQKIIYEQRLDLPLVDRLQKVADDYKVHIQTYTKKDEIICKELTEEVLYYTSKIKIPILTTDKLTSLLDHNPFKMIALSRQGSEALYPFKDYIDANFSAEITTMFSGKGYLELVKKDVGKGTSLKWLCDRLNIPVADSLAAGDSENDLSMIMAAGVGCAMANADDMVKANADFITRKSNEEDGLLELLEAYML